MTLPPLLRKIMSKRENTLWSPTQQEILTVFLALTPPQPQRHKTNFPSFQTLNLYSIILTKLPRQAGCLALVILSQRKHAIYSLYCRFYLAASNCHWGYSHIYIHIPSKDCQPSLSFAIINKTTNIPKDKKKKKITANKNFPTPFVFKT